MKYKFAEIVERTPKGSAQRFRCACGEVHLLGGYVYAHWNDKLHHTCVHCGRVNIVQSGVVRTPISAPKRKKK